MILLLEISDLEKKARRITVIADSTLVEFVATFATQMIGWKMHHVRIGWKMHHVRILWTI